MESDGAPLGGRHLLLAEELALLAIAERHGAFPDTPVLDAALAGAILIELRERRALVLEGPRVAIVERWPTGDPLLDDVVRELEGSTRSVSQSLARIVRSGIAATLVGGLERHGFVVRRRDVVLGLIPVIRYGIVPPRFRLHWAVRIHAVVRADDAADAREHAMLPLLSVAGLLRGFAEPGERDRAERVARALGRGDPIQAAVAHAVVLAEAGEASGAVAVTA